ncbi:LacI family DNA-binding transcriptional regulator [Ligilactobacillus sp. WILCCON 0076]|uniref:LacI family DNA-binding transcriptional regulator n=1 Tax=Ligilactobacillus ubinensis TaxID=2876789 RepID=A0A9X2FKR0_9LACO|nr:LacI family DNA-binding transcriptional regulator [Ligilactobacillus ubinensis]MCP0887479.1 LacI family DNA-binding transcriptional regulator [Ligilactobacillus ubinensis]
MEKLTIKDIAQLANVSTATVSNYINGNFAKMSDKTKEKIRKLIIQTDYHPSSTARNLAKNSNKTIGVSVSDITNPFTSTVLSGIYDACSKEGYTVIFTNANNNSQREIDNINRLRSEEVAGLIIDPVNPNSPIYKIISNKTTVMIDRQANKLRIDTIATDNTDAVSKFVTKMKAAGYNNLYFVSWPLDDISTRSLRYIGFKQATGYQDDDHIVEVPHHGKQDDYQKFTDKLRVIMEKNRKKIGFFAMNGRAFLRLQQSMQTLSYDYPNDYGVGTYEEFDWMKIMNPPISCIHQDSFGIGVTAVRTLIDKLKRDTEFSPRVRIVPTRQVIRDSF